MILDELYKRYHNYLRYEQNYSELTVNFYLKDLEFYLDFCNHYLGEELQPSTEDRYLVDLWLNHLMQTCGKASSAARRLSAVKSFYKFLHKIEYLSHSPIAMLRPPRGNKPLPSFVPSKELERILQDDVDEDDFVSVRKHLIIAMLYECGIRRSELINLQDADVDSQNFSLKVLGKGKKERIVFFGASLAQEIERWRRVRSKYAGSSKLFFITLKGKPLSGSEVYMIVRRTLDSVSGLARRGPHTLRHSFATDMLGNGADLKAIKELMGHSRLSTTTIYTHTSFKQIQQMYNAHHPRAQKKD